ncbi:MAG: TIGR00341 family protein [Myxococcales bacterium]|nr:TIGR00341 family protein [Myxococcales bacterium]
MALRMIEVHVPSDRGEQVSQCLLEAGAEQLWTEQRGEPDRITVVAVVGASETGAALDLLYERVAGADGFRAFVHPLDAVLPRPYASSNAEKRAGRAQSAAGVSREEVYAQVSDAAALDTPYLAFALLASIVAAIGMTSDNTAAVIGAMVVAPLLGPNMGLALGLTLGDRELIRGSARSGIAGFLVAYGAALVLGIALEADLSIAEVAVRTRVTPWDILLGLAAGAACTLAMTTGASASLVGVMVAVALLPPTVASALLLGDGQLRPAGAAFVLTVVNATSILLAAMATFLWRGMRPRHWWKTEAAAESSRRGLVAAAALLAVLAIALAVAQRLAERGA